MSIKGSLKETAGFIKEETGEKLKDNKMTQEGRTLRNEGRVEQGKMPINQPPGTGYKGE